MTATLPYLFMRLFFLCLSYAGNTCIILVMRRAKWRKRADTSKLLFCVLAVIDMCYMTTRVILSVLFIVVLEWLNVVFAGFWVSSALVQSSLCTLTIISIERVVCVFLPLNVHEYCSLIKIKIVLALSIIVTVVLFVLNNMVDNRIIDVVLTLSFAIPASIVTLTTSAIVIKLCMLHKQELGRGSSGMSNTDATGLLIVANICFLVTILPFRIYAVFYLGNETSDADDVLSFCLDLLHDLNFVLNFFVYFTFSVGFRTDALILMGCRSVPGNRARYRV